MILASHNSWSYFTPINILGKLISFSGKCQSKTIKEQYELGVRYFDLRIKFKDGYPIVVHNKIEYCKCYTLIETLRFLDNYEDVYVRVILDIRSKSSITNEDIMNFKEFCNFIEIQYPHIKFVCGECIATKTIEYKFKHNDIPVIEKYSSVSKYFYFLALVPVLYAKLFNKHILNKYKDSDYLMIDFVS